MSPNNSYQVPRRPGGRGVTSQNFIGEPALPYSSNAPTSQQRPSMYTMPVITAESSYGPLHPGTDGPLQLGTGPLQPETLEGAAASRYVKPHTPEPYLFILFDFFY